jgi:localization factor PodJL
MAWFQRSANHGLAPAQYRLGTLYERGLGEKVDLQRARIWYKRAADQGNIKAMHNLAVLSAGRESGKPDYATAAHWFTQAAERGLADSQFNLGVLYENGLGIPQDYQQAYKWYALAVRGGDKEAAKRRDLLATKLDQASFTSAEQLVTAWQAKRADLPANDPRVGAEALRARSIQGAAPTGAAPAVVPAPKPTSAN